MTPSEHDELQKALRVLAERIVKTCREEIEKAHFDKTYTAKIVGIKFNNQYVVEYNGKQLTVKDSLAHVLILEITCVFCRRKITSKILLSFLKPEVLETRQRAAIPIHIQILMYCISLLKK